MAKDIERVIRLLKAEAGGRKAVVSRRTPFMVLISAVLSARTRDSSTAAASARLFSKFRTPESIADASTKELRSLIRPCGFYRVKARTIKKLSREVLARFNGRVPSSIEELLSLPGVGRKTANCVLVYAFKKAAIPVDVHVHRISNRIGLVKTRSPEETEAALSRAVPRKHWIEINRLMVRFGQERCRPLRPLCPGCALAGVCGCGNSIKAGEQIH